MARKKINSPTIHSGKIPEKALIKPQQTPSTEYPTFSFLHVCDNHCRLSAWQGQELIDLVNTFKKMESLTWVEIARHSGLRFKKIEGYTKPLPPDVSPEVTVYEVRVCEVKRLFGYRINNIFRVLWFDREHEVCPFNKQKRA